MGDRPSKSPARHVSGACLCGAVRFEVNDPLERVGHCHCSMCQRAHGAAFVTWAAVPKARVRITAGEVAMTRYRSSAAGTRAFCSICGSSLFCWHEANPGIIDIAVASLAPGHGAVPRAHSFWDDRVEWTAPAADGLPRFGGESGTEPR